MKKTKNIFTKITNKLLTIKSFVLLGGILLMVGIAFYLSNKPSMQQTWTAATTIQPEHFTELYFNDHTKLPKDIKTDKVERFEFTVHNLEYKDMDYQYEVYVASSGAKLMLDTGIIHLKHDKYATVKESYRPAISIQRAKIIVNLINKNQQIGFWIQKPNNEL